MTKKIALAVITRDTKEDALLLENLLNSVSQYIDGFFITAAHDKFEGHIKKVCDKYKAHYSEFKWVNDFSAARNFNFSQVTEDYNYIMWSDIDDTWSDLSGLRDYLKIERDGYAFFYLYDFDEDNQPTVVHKKTMLVKNDGTFIWKGAIHEDLDNDREITIGFIEDIHRIHHPTEERVEEAAARNLEISIKAADALPDDPRVYFNLGNSLLGAGKTDEAIKVFERFISESQSKEEKYLVYQRLAWCHHDLGNEDLAEKCFQMAIGLIPVEPEAYLEIGKFYFSINKLEEAEENTLMGLKMKPSYKAIIVFNPRDYDYNPLALLAKVYFQKGRPDKAYQCMKACLEISDNKRMRELTKEMKGAMEGLKEVEVLIEEMKKVKDKKELKKLLDKVPQKHQSHPGICSIRNSIFIKEESSGNDLSIYCGMTVHEWNPILFREKGFGGSEEAIVHLSKALAAKGMNVKVYANIGPKRIVEDGVEWIPYWEFNTRDKTDFLVLWRSIQLCDYELNAGKVFVDIHDVMSPAEFTKDRLKKVDKLFVKTQIHRELFPNVPDEKFAIIPNGINVDDFTGKQERDPNLVINTSSPDRSLSMFVKIAEKVKEQIPEAKFKWAYGWELFETYREDKKSKDFMKKVETHREKVGVESLGKIPQKECNELYEKAGVFLFPTEFMEIDCISVKKAQLAGCNVVTTDFGALDESTKYGTKIHSKKDRLFLGEPGGLDFSCDEALLDQFVKATVKAIKEGKENKDAKIWAREKFNYDVISTKWYNTLYGI